MTNFAEGGPQLLPLALLPLVAGDEAAARELLQHLRARHQRLGVGLDVGQVLQPEVVLLVVQPLGDGLPLAVAQQLPACRRAG